MSREMRQKVCSMALTLLKYMGFFASSEEGPLATRVQEAEVKQSDVEFMRR
jgi:hypothetical protein